MTSASESETEAEAGRPFISEDPSEWDHLIERMARLKADLSRIQNLATDETVPFDLKAAIGFAASDYDSLIRDIVEYEEGGEMPDTCPVCGESVVTRDAELEAGESYSVERICVTETSVTGRGDGILHWGTATQEGSADAD